MDHSRIGFLTAALLASTAICAQVPFGVAYGTDDTLTVNTSSFKVCEAANGELMLAAYTLPDSVAELYVLHTAADGSLLHASALRTPGFSIMVTDMAALPDGSFAVVGQEGTKGLLWRLSAAGDLMQAFHYTAGTSCHLWSVWPRTDSTVMVAGDSRVSSNDNLLIMELQLDGTILSAQRVEVGGRESNGHLHCELADGGALLVGMSSDSSANGSFVPRNLAMVRLDANGEIQWGKRLLSDNALRPAFGMVELPDGDLMLACQYRAASDQVPFMARLSPLGVPRWCRAMPQFEGTEFVGMARHTSGHLVLAGYSGGWDDDVFVADTSGTLLQAGTFIGAGLITDVQPMQSGEVLMACSPLVPLTTRLLGLSRPDLASGCFAFIDPLPSLDFVLTTAEGYVGTTILPTVQDVTATYSISTPPMWGQVICLSTGRTDAAPSPVLALLPNPVADVAVLAGSDIQQVTVMDALGRVMWTQRFASTTHAPLDLHALIPGVYTLLVRCGEEESPLRFVKE